MDIQMTQWNACASASKKVSLLSSLAIFEAMPSFTSMLIGFFPFDGPGMG
jgi:hypothetical protein